MEEMHCMAWSKGFLLRTVVGVSNVGHFAKTDVDVSFKGGVARVQSWEKHSHGKLIDYC